MSGIDTLLLEERRYAPPPEFAAHANAQPDIYERDPLEFWETEGRTRISWFEPFHALGHGVGLEIHEQPILGLVGSKELVAGDVVTVEPGLYRQGFGGVRLEDLVLVTDEGYENLTEFPYDLAP